ncbi:uncharacterized protein LOC111193901 isoform X2 [Astyanax mexicanus]|uniref:uncharacterized protein LOC111193901 isoform X2 n=1 Tax=Astyanax mexicanus TaxID=7994 RepID=UPI0020CA9D35|nr:uncharacterized protein LOC111193901 isoform X2 [Astyanax mexicanus]
MCAVRGILGGASIAALAIAAGGSLYYLYRSRTQKPTTTEETTVTPVEGDPETVEERQAEPMVEPVLSETVMELVEEDGGVDCPKEEDQVTLIMDEAPEALSLLQVTDLTESEESEVTLNTELCESVVETLVEDGGVDCPQEEDQTTLIMDEAPEALSLLQVTDLTKSEEAEVTLNTELCESVVETLVEDGGVDCPQEEDQATLIMDGALEAASLLQVTELTESEEAEVTLNTELCESVVETLVEDGGVDCPQEEDQATLIMDGALEAASLLQVTDLTESEEAEVTLNTELCESVVETLEEDGGVDCPQEEDQTTFIMDEAPEAPSLLLGTHPAETKEAETEAECRPEAEYKKKQKIRGRRGRSRKLRRLGRLRRRGRLGKRGRRLYK